MIKTAKDNIHPWNNIKRLHCYEFGASSSNSSDPTLKKCLSDAVTLTKNADIGK